MLNPILLVEVGKCLRSDIPFYDSDWRGEAKGGGTDQVNYRKNKSGNYQEARFPRITSEEAAQKNDVK